MDLRPIVTLHHVLVYSPIGELLFSAGPIADFQSEPLGEPLAVNVAAIATVKNVAQLMYQDVIEIEIADRLLRPDELPANAAVLPASAIHVGLNPLRRLRRLGERFDQRLLDRIEINCVAPLHPIARS